MHFLPRDPASAVIVLLICIVGGSIALTPPDPVVSRDPTGDAAARDADRDGLGIPSPSVDGLDEDYSETLLRPLFEPDRVPREVAETTADPDAGESDTLSMLTGGDTIGNEPKLIGIALEPSHATAVFRAPNKATVELAREGDEVFGWTVREIKPDQVTISGLGGDRRLVLERRSDAAGRTSMDLVRAANSGHKLLIEQLRAATDLADFEGQPATREQTPRPAAPIEQAPDTQQ